MKTLQCSFFSAPKILDTCKNSDFHPILHFQGRKASMVHAYTQRSNSMVVYLWAKGENSQVKSWSLRSSGLEGTSRCNKYNCNP